MQIVISIKINICVAIGNLLPPFFNLIFRKKQKKRTRFVKSISEPNLSGNCVWFVLLTENYKNRRRQQVHIVQTTPCRKDSNILSVGIHWKLANKPLL